MDGRERKETEWKFAVCSWGFQPIMSIWLVLVFSDLFCNETPLDDKVFLLSFTQLQYILENLRLLKTTSTFQCFRFL